MSYIKKAAINNVNSMLSDVYLPFDIMHIESTYSTCVNDGDVVVQHGNIKAIRDTVNKAISNCEDFKSIDVVVSLIPVSINYTVDKGLSTHNEAVLNELIQIRNTANLFFSNCVKEGVIKDVDTSISCALTFGPNTIRTTRTAKPSHIGWELYTELSGGVVDCGPLVLDGKSIVVTVDGLGTYQYINGTFAPDTDLPFTMKEVGNITTKLDGMLRECHPYSSASEKFVFLYSLGNYETYVKYATVTEICGIVKDRLFDIGKVPAGTKVASPCFGVYRIMEGSREPEIITTPFDTQGALLEAIGTMFQSAVDSDEELSGGGNARMVIKVGKGKEAITTRHAEQLSDVGVTITPAITAPLFDNKTIALHDLIVTLEINRKVGYRYADGKVTKLPSECFFYKPRNEITPAQFDGLVNEIKQHIVNFKPMGGPNAVDDVFDAYTRHYDALLIINGETASNAEYDGDGDFIDRVVRMVNINVENEDLDKLDIHFIDEFNSIVAKMSVVYINNQWIGVPWANKDGVPIEDLYNSIRKSIYKGCAKMPMHAFKGATIEPSDIDPELLRFYAKDQHNANKEFGAKPTSEEIMSNWSYAKPGHDSDEEANKTLRLGTESTLNFNVKLTKNDGTYSVDEVNTLASVIEYRIGSVTPYPVQVFVSQPQKDPNDTIETLDREMVDAVTNTLKDTLEGVVVAIVKPLSEIVREELVERRKNKAKTESNDSNE